MKRTKSYDENLNKRLLNKDYAKEYLNAVLEDDGPDLKERFLLAIRDVAKAHKISHVAENSNITREALYRALSENGNPELGTIISVLGSIGIKLRVDTGKAS